MILSRKAVQPHTHELHMSKYISLSSSLDKQTVGVSERGARIGH